MDNEINNLDFTEDSFSEFDKRSFSKKNKIYLIILGAVIVILLAIIFYFFYSNSEKNKPIENISLEEIYEKAESEGTSFCNKIVNDEMRRECLFYTIKEEAMKKANPELCFQLKEEYAKNCIEQVVFKTVTQKYANNEEINYSLCEFLDDEEKRMCQSPEEIFVNCYRGLCYA